LYRCTSQRRISSEYVEQTIVAVEKHIRQACGSKRLKNSLHHLQLFADLKAKAQEAVPLTLHLGGDIRVFSPIKKAVSSHYDHGIFPGSQRTQKFLKIFPSFCRNNPKLRLGDMLLQ
jgi:hypothetical protein